MNTPLVLKDFNYTVPEELVAQQPLPRRDDAKLLVWQHGEIRHENVKNLAELVPEQSLFIVNDSKVIASRIRFQLPTGAHSEFLLLEPKPSDAPNGNEDWLALARPMRKLKAGIAYDVGHDLKVAILATNEANDGSGPRPIVIRVSKQGSDFLEWLTAHGEMPLPPYIERRNVDQRVATQDKERYQTVYAGEHGSVAAPTAGLHFTETVMETLKAKGCEFAKVTLHVGAGTFLPVKAENIVDHEMHSERFMVPKATLDKIQAAQRAGRPIIVVGTTALRSLEGLERLAVETKKDKSDLIDRWQRTNIFIRPEYRDSRHKSWVASALMTNFHQPESTLIMLVSALVGYNDIQRIYAEAIASKYRLFSYGDSSLLWLD